MSLALADSALELQGLVEVSLDASEGLSWAWQGPGVWQGPGKGHGADIFHHKGTSAAAAAGRRVGRRWVRQAGRCRMAPLPASRARLQVAPGGSTWHQKAPRRHQEAPKTQQKAHRRLQVAREGSRACKLVCVVGPLAQPTQVWFSGVWCLECTRRNTIFQERHPVPD